MLNTDASFVLISLFCCLKNEPLIILILHIVRQNLKSSIFHDLCLCLMNNFNLKTTLVNNISILKKILQF